jgi:hypothetical protein
VTSSALFVGGVVIFYGLVPSPKEIGLPDPDSDESIDSNQDENDQENLGIN